MTLPPSATLTTYVVAFALGGHDPGTPFMFCAPSKSHAPAEVLTWGDNSVSSCRPYSRAKGPGTSGEPKFGVIALGSQLQQGTPRLSGRGICEHAHLVPPWSEVEIPVAVGVLAAGTAHVSTAAIG